MLGVVLGVVPGIVECRGLFLLFDEGTCGLTTVCTVCTRRVPLSLHLSCTIGVFGNGFGQGLGRMCSTISDPIALYGVLRGIARDEGRPGF